jgi:hypothetical protein
MLCVGICCYPDLLKHHAPNCGLPLYLSEIYVISWVTAQASHEHKALNISEPAYHIGFFVSSLCG